MKVAGNARPAELAVAPAAEPVRPRLIAVQGSGEARRGEERPHGHLSPLARRVDLMWRMSFDSIMVVDEDRHFRHINAPAMALLGAPADAIIGARIDDFTPLPLLSVLEGLWADLSRDGWLEGTYEVLRGDGRRRLAEYRAQTGFDTGRRLIVARPASPATLAAADPRGRVLTPREREVLQLAADGLSAAAIAAELSLSVGTVKSHLENVHAKLGVSNRAAAVASALRLGAID